MWPFNQTPLITAAEAGTEKLTDIPQDHAATPHPLQHKIEKFLKLR